MSLLIVICQVIWNQKKWTKFEHTRACFKMTKVGIHRGHNARCCYTPSQKLVFIDFRHFIVFSSNCVLRNFTWLSMPQTLRNLDSTSWTTTELSINARNFQWNYAESRNLYLISKTDSSHCKSDFVNFDFYRFLFFLVRIDDASNQDGRSNMYLLEKIFVALGNECSDTVTPSVQHMAFSFKPSCSNAFRESKKDYKFLNAIEKVKRFR